VKGVVVAVAPVSSALLQLVRAHASLAVGMLADIGLAPPQELVLLYLAEHGPSPQRDLVRYLGRDRSTVTATVQAMERNALIERSPSTTDGRALTVRLTRRGSGLCPRVNAIWTELEQTTFGWLTPPQRSRLVRTLADAQARASAGRPSGGLRR
jgi:DNA-binding MarR family transcriptional regulator